MNDDEFGERLAQAIDARVRHTRSAPDVDDLFARSEQLRRRDRRRFAALAVPLALVAAGVGLLVGSVIARDDSPAPAIVVPRAPAKSDLYVPADIARATTGIESAYRTVFGAGATDDQRVAALQLGPELLPSMQQSAAIARRFGMTEDDLARATVTVTPPSFIDATHAIVRFTIIAPDRGPLVRDRIGYAVWEDGRWKVAARTVCDLVLPTTISAACPAAARAG